MPFWSSSSKKTTSPGRPRKPRKAPPPQPFPPGIVQAQRKESSKHSDKAAVQHSHHSDSRSHGSGASRRHRSSHRGSYGHPEPRPVAFASSITSAPEPEIDMDAMGGGMDDLFGGLDIMGSNVAEPGADIRMTESEEIRMALAMSMSDEPQPGAVSQPEPGAAAPAGFGFVASSASSASATDSAAMDMSMAMQMPIHPAAVASMSSASDMGGLMSMGGISSANASFVEESSTSGAPSAFGFIGGGTAAAVVPADAELTDTGTSSSQHSHSHSGGGHHSGSGQQPQPGGFGFIQETSSVASAEIMQMEAEMEAADAVAASGSQQPIVGSGYDDVFGGLQVADDSLDLVESLPIQHRSGSPLDDDLDLESVASSMISVPAIPSGSGSASVKGMKGHMRYDTSIIGQMQRAKRDFSRKESELWTQIQTTMEKEIDIRSEEQSLLLELAAKKEQVKEHESLKKKALANDNFTEASKQRKFAEECKKRIKEINGKYIPKLKRDLALLRKQKRRQEKDLIRKCERFSEKVSKFEEKHSSAKEDYSVSEEYRLESAKASIESAMNSIEVELETANDEVAKFEDELTTIHETIEEENEPLVSRMEELSKSKSAIEVDIGELQKLLLAKQSELKECQDCVGQLEDDISVVSGKYKEDLDRIEDEKAKALAKKLRINERREVHTVELDKNEAEHCRFEERVCEFECELSEMGYFTEKCGEVVSRLTLLQLQIKDWDDAETALNNDLRKIRGELTAMGSSKARHESELNVAESKTIEVRRRVQSIEESLPRLHSDKALAVSQENYAEAGEIHATIKKKEAEKERLTKQLAKCNEQRRALKKELQTAVANENTLKSRIEEFQSRIDFSRFKFLLSEKTCFVKAKEEIELMVTKAIDLVKERSASDEAASDERAEDEARNQFEQEINVVEFELRQCESELKSLSDLYGWTLSLSESQMESDAPPTASATLSADSSAAVDLFATVSASMSASPRPKADGSSADAAIHMNDATLFGAEKEEKCEELTLPQLEAKLSSTASKLQLTRASLQDIVKQIGEAIAREDFMIPAQLKPAKDSLLAKVDELEKEEKELRSQIEALTTVEEIEVEPEPEVEESKTESMSAPMASESATVSEEVEVDKFSASDKETPEPMRAVNDAVDEISEERTEESSTDLHLVETESKEDGTIEEVEEESDKDVVVGDDCDTGIEAVTGNGVKSEESFVAEMADQSPADSLREDELEERGEDKLTEEQPLDTGDTVATDLFGGLQEETQE